MQTVTDLYTYIEYQYSRHDLTQDSTMLET